MENQSATEKLQEQAMQLEVANAKVSVLERTLSQCVNGNIDLQARFELLSAKYNEMAQEFEKSKSEPRSDAKNPKPKK